MIQRKSKKLTQTVPGLALMVQGQKKNYSFTHGEVDTKRNYTLGGLYSEVSEVSQTNQEKTTFSSVRESVWGESPDPSSMDRLGFALRTLPTFMSSFNTSLLDDELKEFHYQAKKVKENLLKNSRDGIIAPADMKKAEGYMEEYNLSGWTLKVIAIRVSEEPFHGSRKRADNLYEKRQSLRSVYIKEDIEQGTLDALLDYLEKAISGEYVEIISTTPMYRAVKKNDSVLFIPDKEIVGEVIDEEIRVSRELPPGVKSLGTSSIFGSKS